MDWLTFAAEIAKSFVWPLTVILIVFYLGNSLKDLIPQLSRLKYRDFEVKFSKKLSMVRNELEKPDKKYDSELSGKDDQPMSETNQSEADDSRDPLFDIDEFYDYYEELTKVSPRATVLEAWTEFETKIDGIATKLATESLHAENKEHFDWKTKLRILRQSNVISVRERLSILRIKSLRDQVAHDLLYIPMNRDAYDYAITLQDLGAEIQVRTMEKYSAG